jgi:hypothetical protein
VPGSSRGIARAFVVVNRLFGWVAVASGILLGADVVSALVRGQPLRELWLLGASAIAAILVGLIYVRAPLSRTRAVNSVDKV